MTVISSIEWLLIFWLAKVIPNGFSSRVTMRNTKKIVNNDWEIRASSALRTRHSSMLKKAVMHSKCEDRARAYGYDYHVSSSHSSDFFTGKFHIVC